MRGETPSRAKAHPRDQRIKVPEVRVRRVSQNANMNRTDLNHIKDNGTPNGMTRNGGAKATGGVIRIHHRGDGEVGVE